MYLLNKISRKGASVRNPNDATLDENTKALRGYRDSEPNVSNLVNYANFSILFGTDIETMYSMT